MFVPPVAVAGTLPPLVPPEASGPTLPAIVPPVVLAPPVALLTTWPPIAPPVVEATVTRVDPPDAMVATLPPVASAEAEVTVLPPQSAPQCSRRSNQTGRYFAVPLTSVRLPDRLTGRYGSRSVAHLTPNGVTLLPVMSRKLWLQPRALFLPLRRRKRNPRVPTRPRPMTPGADGECPGTPQLQLPSGASFVGAPGRSAVVPAALVPPTLGSLSTVLVGLDVPPVESNVFATTAVPPVALAPPVFACPPVPGR
jgi:hypothetical protein